jgi:hypothetical protein
MYTLLASLAAAAAAMISNNKQSSSTRGKCTEFREDIHVECCGIQLRKSKSTFVVVSDNCRNSKLSFRSPPPLGPHQADVGIDDSRSGSNSSFRQYAR